MGITRRAAIVNAALVGLASAPRIRSARAAGGSVLRFVPPFDLRGMDPIVNTDLATLQHGYMIYDTLFAMDRSFRPRPQMVDTFQISGDGLTYDFRLRAGLSFHDGTAVTATDCVASVRRWGARDVMGRLLMGRLSDLAAIDETWFRIRLAQPFPLLIEALAKISSSPCFIMRARDAATDPAVPVTANIGSGPFRFLPDSFVSGAQIVYAANSAYVPLTDPADGYAGAKRAGVDRVEWRIIRDPAVQVNALLEGEVDILSAPQLDLLTGLRRAPNVEVRRLDRIGWMTYIRPNHLFPPFNDIRARQALAHLVDQSDYMAAAAGERENWGTCWSFLACGSAVASTDGVANYGTPDLPRARQLLAASGYAGEPIVVLDPVDNAIFGNLAAVTISQLRKIDVNVRPLAMDTAGLMAMRASAKPPAGGGWHLFHGMSLGVELANPLTNFPLASPCDIATGWFGWPCDGAVEALRQQWAQASDETERFRIAALLQQAAARSLPFIPLGRVYVPVAYRKLVRDLPEMPVPVLWNASIRAG